MPMIGVFSISSSTSISLVVVESVDEAQIYFLERVRLSLDWCTQNLLIGLFELAFRRDEVY